MNKRSNADIKNRNQFMGRFNALYSKLSFRMAVVHKTSI
jgi:tetrahydromethanopterin S-methyltransferase subunit F